MIKSGTKVLFVALLAAYSLSQARAMTLKTDSAGKTQTVTGKPIPAKPTDISPLLIGEAIPAVILPDAGGKMFNLNEAATKKPTILIFYRGGWCPYCNKELAGMQGIEADLTKMGYQIVAISTDSPENLAKSMGKHQLTYTLLSDSELSVAKQFGLAYVAPKNYGDLLIKSSGGKNVDKLLPVPSVFILDAKGLIQFEYINPDYQQRMSPTLLTAVAGALKDEMKAKN
jgi:peroxiredoxin